MTWFCGCRCPQRGHGTSASGACRCSRASQQCGHRQRWLHNLKITVLTLSLHEAQSNGCATSAGGSSSSATSSPSSTCSAGGGGSSTHTPRAAICCCSSRISCGFAAKQMKARNWTKIFCTLLLVWRLILNLIARTYRSWFWPGRAGCRSRPKCWEAARASGSWADGLLCGALAESGCPSDVETVPARRRVFFYPWQISVFEIRRSEEVTVLRVCPRMTSNSNCSLFYKNNNNARIQITVDVAAEMPPLLRFHCCIIEQ